MEKQFFMKKMLVLSFLFISLALNAQLLKNDSVVMTIADKQVSLSEFEFIAGKNNGVNLSDEKSLKEYVELFKIFKLKVAEAEELKIDTTKAFNEELNSYKAQLVAGYLRDRNAEEDVAKTIYDKGSEYLSISLILYPLPEKSLPKDTVAVYEKVMQAANRIQKGEDFDKVGLEIAETSDEQEYKIFYAMLPSFLPLEHPKPLEEAAYSMKTGEISRPIRTQHGFYLIKVNDRKPYPGKIHIAHVRIPLKSDSIQAAEEAQRLADELYNKALAGEELASLIKEYSLDNEQANGVLPPFGPGQIIKPIEDVAFSLTSKGELSKPFLTEFGYHIVQLIEKASRPSFEQEKERIVSTMSNNNRNFELFNGFDERLKKEFNYTFYPEAYAELEKICEDCFPGTTDFALRVKEMDKVLFRIDGQDVPLFEFSRYLTTNPISTQTYAGDFMKEVYDLFIREVVTSLEKDQLLEKYPEILLLIQEYRDGMLLFEISNQKIWSKSADEQKTLEDRWIADLNKKYKTSINWNLLKKLKK